MLLAKERAYAQKNTLIVGGDNIGMMSKTNCCKSSKILRRGLQGAHATRPLEGGITGCE